MQFQWYPGHMTKAKRQMQEDIKLIDLVIELVDARIPLSSRNPDIDELGKHKSRLIIMNKSDLSDETLNMAWAAYFKKLGYFICVTLQHESYFSLLFIHKLCFVFICTRDWNYLFSFIFLLTDAKS